MSRLHGRGRVELRRSADLKTPGKYNHPVWTGATLTLLGAVSYFTFFARFPALRDVPLLNLALLGLGLLLSALGVRRAFGPAPRYRGRVLAGIGLAFSLVLVLAFNFYVFSLSYSLPSPTSTTLSMTRAPEFTLPDQHGGAVRLADYRGRKVVLTFYRGHW